MTSIRDEIKRWRDFRVQVGGKQQINVTYLNWLISELEQAREAIRLQDDSAAFLTARIAELESLHVDAYHNGRREALDRAADMRRQFCWNNGDVDCKCEVCQYAAAIRKLKEPSDGVAAEH